MYLKSQKAEGSKNWLLNLPRVNVIEPLHNIFGEKGLIPSAFFEHVELENGWMDLGVRGGILMNIQCLELRFVQYTGWTPQSERWDYLICQVKQPGPPGG